MEEAVAYVNTLKVKELQGELQARHIAIKGNKAELCARLVKEVRRDFLEKTYEETDDAGASGGGDTKDDFVDDAIHHEDDDDVNIDDDAINHVATAFIRKSTVFTFKDVEESLQRFSGDRKQNLQKWITDFEETATILKWSDIHKLVYAKRLLTGAAKMFINVEKSVKSYDQLIKCLKDEFGQALSSVKIHKQLMDTKKLQSETYREYLYRMMAIAEQANIEDLLLTEWLQDDIVDEFCGRREVLRRDAKQQILKIQDENKKGFNKRRREAHQYKVNDLVAIKRTQFGSGLKLRGKFLGPYRVTSVKGMERYDVSKVDDHEGPGNTSTCAEFMKPWSDYGVGYESSESDECQDGRV